MVWASFVDLHVWAGLHFEIGIEPRYLCFKHPKSGGNFWLGDLFLANASMNQKDPYTFPKTNIVHENRPSQNESSFPKTIFRGTLFVSFWRCSHPLRQSRRWAPTR